MKQRINEDVCIGTSNISLKDVKEHLQNGKVYSTTEKVIGKFTDNKLVYEKTFIITDTKTAQASYSTTINIAELNIDTMVDTKYEFWHGNANWATVNVETSNYYASSTDRCRLYRTKTSTYDRFNFNCYVNEQNIKLIITTRYTKNN